MRHNNLRDLNGNFQQEVCRDVVLEPQLIKLQNEDVSGTQADRAAPDISSRGLWSTFERTFYDVRVFCEFLCIHIMSIYISSHV